MHITDEERQELLNLIIQLRDLAREERKSGDLRRQQNAVKSRFIGHAEAYEDAANRLELIIAPPEKQASDAKQLTEGAGESDLTSAE